MSQTLDTAGRPLFFPSSLVTDEAGVILPRPMAELAPLVDQVAPEQLFPFLRRLINGTSKRKREARWSAVNRQRLQLARLCIDRALADQLYSLPKDDRGAGGVAAAAPLVSSRQTPITPHIARSTSRSKANSKHTLRG